MHSKRLTQKWSQMMWNKTYPTHHDIWPTTLDILFGLLHYFSNEPFWVHPRIILLLVKSSVSAAVWSGHFAIFPFFYLKPPSHIPPELWTKKQGKQRKKLRSLLACLACYSIPSAQKNPNRHKLSTLSWRCGCCTISISISCVWASDAVIRGKAGLGFEVTGRLSWFASFVSAYVEASSGEWEGFVMYI